MTRSADETAKRATAFKLKAMA